MLWKRTGRSDCCNSKWSVLLFYYLSFLISNLYLLSLPRLNTRLVSIHPTAQEPTLLPMILNKTVNLSQNLQQSIVQYSIASLFCWVTINQIDPGTILYSYKSTIIYDCISSIFYHLWNSSLEAKLSGYNASDSTFLLLFLLFHSFETSESCNGFFRLRAFSLKLRKLLSSTNSHNIFDQI